jgi:hypothetical protein
MSLIQLLLYFIPIPCTVSFFFPFFFCEGHANKCGGKGRDIRTHGAAAWGSTPNVLKKCGFHCSHRLLIIPNWQVIYIDSCLIIFVTCICNNFGDVLILGNVNVEMGELGNSPVIKH